MLAPFHLSIPTDDLERARAFYVELLGCRIGRSSARRMDVDFFGHHVVMHLAPGEAERDQRTIDGERDPSPMRHFGVILPLDTWRELAARLKKAGVSFVLEPKVINRGTVAEQSIMLARDNCGNVVEFKSIPAERIFATEPAVSSEEEEGPARP